jgi:hypothetical protein
MGLFIFVSSSVQKLDPNNSIFRDLPKNKEKHLLYFSIRIVFPINCKLYEIENPKISKNRLPLLHSQHPLPPSVYWLLKSYNRSFGYGCEAVGIRVKSQDRRGCFKCCHFECLPYNLFRLKQIFDSAFLSL